MSRAAAIEFLVMSETKSFSIGKYASSDRNQYSSIHCEHGAKKKFPLRVRLGFNQKSTIMMVLVDFWSQCKIQAVQTARVHVRTSLENWQASNLFPAHEWQDQHQRDSKIIKKTFRFVWKYAPSLVHTCAETQKCLCFIEPFLFERMTTKSHHCGGTNWIFYLLSTGKVLCSKCTLLFFVSKTGTSPWLWAELAYKLEERQRSMPGQIWFSATMCWKQQDDLSITWTGFSFITCGLLSKNGNFRYSNESWFFGENRISWGRWPHLNVYSWLHTRASAQQIFRCARTAFCAVLIAVPAKRVSWKWLTMIAFRFNQVELRVFNCEQIQIDITASALLRSQTEHTLSVSRIRSDDMLPHPQFPSLCWRWIHVERTSIQQQNVVALRIVPSILQTSAGCVVSSDSSFESECVGW